MCIRDRYQPAGLSADITQAPITALIIGNPTKVYDGSASTTLTNANYTLLGFATVGGVTQGAAVPQSATASYAAPDAGTGVAIGSTLVLSDFVANSGTNLSNYALPAIGAGTGTITQAPLSARLIGNPSKTYDDTATASLAAGNYALSGFVGSQSATVNQAAGTYASAEAGSQSVTAALTSANFSPASNTNLSNYALPASATGTGTDVYKRQPPTPHWTRPGDSVRPSFNMPPPSRPPRRRPATDFSTVSHHRSPSPRSPAPLSATSSVSKTYDGTTRAILSGSNTTFGGFIGSDGATVNAGVTGTFATANVGTGIAVTGGALTAGNLTATGSTLLSNYTLPTTDNGSGRITAATLT